MAGPLDQHWVKYLAPGLVVPLLGIQLVQGFRGFLPPPDGLVGHLAAPGTLLGWGGVLVLAVLLSWLILGWWGRDPSGVRGLPGLLVRLMGCVVLGIAVAGLFGTGGETAGGGRIGAGLASLLTGSLGTFFAVVLLLLMAVPGSLLAAAPFLDGPADASTMRPPPPDLAGLVPPPGIFEGSVSREPGAYPERRYDEEGNEIPMALQGRDVGPIRVREEGEEEVPEAPSAPEPAPVPDEDALPYGVRFADADRDEEPARDEEEPDDGEAEPAATEDAGDREDAADGEDAPADASQAMTAEADADLLTTPETSPTEGAVDDEPLPPGVRWADDPAPPEDDGYDEDDIFAPRVRREEPPSAPPEAEPAPPVPPRPVGQRPPPARAEVPPPLSGPGAPAVVPSPTPPRAGDSVRAAMDAYREDGGEGYRRKLEGTGIFDEPPPTPPPAAAPERDAGDAGATRKAATRKKASTPKKKAAAKKKTIAKKKATPAKKATAKKKASTRKAVPAKASASKTATRKTATRKTSTKTRKTAPAATTTSTKRKAKAPAKMKAAPTAKTKPETTDAGQPARAKAAGRKGAAPASDDLFDRAVEVAFERGAASSVLLSRKLGIGYSRARALMDALVEARVLGEMTPSGARPLLLTPEDWKKRSR